MCEKITVVVYATTGYRGSKNEYEVEVDKSEYDQAKNKDVFLQEIHDEFIGNVVETGVYIKE